MSALTPGRRPVTYDYTPFLSTPTITSRISPLSGPTAIPIPETDIVSPLADHVTPEVLLELKAWLTGISFDGQTLPPTAVSLSGRWRGPGSSLGREKGEEIWKSWKRAWDLWNGFYIEGRVDPVWVREEYGRVKVLLEEERNRPVEKVKEILPAGWNANAAHGHSQTGDPNSFRSMSVASDDDARLVQPWGDHTPPEPKLRPAAEVAKQDGSTGGFMPMKLLPEYLAPDTDDDGNYPEDWEDVLATTVWRPRRTGERDGEVEVGIDEPWGKESEFEFDGGVDCGRSPYPCLRYVVGYVRRDGCFLKKKVWDQVTGTIFNMPTLPANPDKITDERRIRMNALFGDFYRDKARQHRNPDYFPLDIRRLDKIDPTTGKRHAGTPLLENKESLARWPWNNPEGALQDLDESDPWYVTEEQQERQLVPPRKYPPPKQPCAGGDTLLPTDDTIWKEEIDNDEKYRSNYFVTNLHGGPLVINGQEVKLGEIAGPLPEFAVIETPGNQISFWFGPDGRNWRGCDDDPSLYTSQWQTIRLNPDWEHIGLTAGQMWDLKIRDRLRREYIGSEHHDDEQWAEWKCTVTKEIPQTQRTSPLDLVIWDGRYGTSPAEHMQTPEEAQLEFSNELEELEWLVTKAQPLKDVTPMLEEQNIIVPLAKALWPGPEICEGPEITHARNSKKSWDSHKSTILQQQRDMNAKLAEKRDARAAKKKQRIDAENKKRKAESSEGPAAKKARLDAATEALAKADAQREKDRAARRLEEDRRIEEARRKQEDADLLQHATRIDAEISQAQAAQDAKNAAEKLKEDLEQFQKEDRERIAADIKKREDEEKRKEDEEKQNAGAAHNQERIDQGLDPDPAVTARNEEEKLRFIQEQKDRQARLAAEAAQRKKEAEQKRADEEQRKEAEQEKEQREADRKKKEQEAEQQRKDKAQKEYDEALKKRAEKHEADKSIADQLKKAEAEYQERQRQRYALQQKAKLEKEKTQKERDEQERRIQLFKDKYGHLPAKGEELDPMGEALGKNEPPPGGPSSETLDFGPLTPDQIMALSDAQLGQYLMQQFSNAGKAVFEPDDVEAAMIEQAVQNSLLDLDEFAQAINRSALLRAAQNTRAFKNMKAALEQRAMSDGVTATEYALRQGYESLANCMEVELRPQRPDDYPKLRGDPEDPANLLLVGRYTIRREAREGLNVRARLENRTVEEIVKEKGHASLGVYLQTLEDSLTYADTIKGVRDGWEAFCRRITDASEWDARISTLPTRAPPQTRGGRLFAEL